MTLPSTRRREALVRAARGQRVEPAGVAHDEHEIHLRNRRGMFSHERGWHADVEGTGRRAHVPQVAGASIPCPSGRASHPATTRSPRSRRARNRTGGARWRPGHRSASSRSIILGVCRRRQASSAPHEPVDAWRRWQPEAEHPEHRREERVTGEQPERLAAGRSSSRPRIGARAGSSLRVRSGITAVKNLLATSAGEHRHRILGGIVAAVRERVPDLERLDRPERLVAWSTTIPRNRQAGTIETTSKATVAASRPRPAPTEDDDALREAADAHQPELEAEQLQHHRTWTKPAPAVEVAGLEQRAELCSKPSTVGERECDVDHPVEHRDSGKLPAAGAKRANSAHTAENSIAGHEQVADQLHRERRAVLQLARIDDRDVANVEAQSPSSSTLHDEAPYTPREQPAPERDEHERPCELMREHPGCARDRDVAAEHSRRQVEHAGKRQRVQHRLRPVGEQRQRDDQPAEHRRAGRDSIGTPSPVERPHQGDIHQRRQRG